jgi:hypothetical protein
MVRKTRRARPSATKTTTTPLTIPQLRRAFESIDRFVAKSPSVADFQKHWKKTFGKPVSAEAARDYLQFATAAKKTQGGGGPAPIGYELTEPAGAAPNSPPYLASGFGFANVPSFISQCGTVDVKNPVPAGIGSNHVGGKRRSRKQKGGTLSSAFAEFTSRPFGMLTPPTQAQDLQSLAHGNNTLASPRPEFSTFDFARPQIVFGATLPKSSISY